MHREMISTPPEAGIAGHMEIVPLSITSAPHLAAGAVLHFAARDRDSKPEQAGRGKAPTRDEQQQASDRRDRGESIGSIEADREKGQLGRDPDVV